jgi:hypothetical protein
LHINLIFKKQNLGSTVASKSTLFYYPLTRRNPPGRDRYLDYLNRGRSVNKLALQALNAVNLISQYQEEEEGGTKVTFV